MRSISSKAPAKINIGLNILSKRDDGFHNLKTFFYPIYDLYDTITFEKSDHFSFSSTEPNIKPDNSNLIVKALTEIQQIINKKLNVKIKLEKKIPIGGGLGGGSSDAAATLLSLNSLFELNLTNDQLFETALELGSDVPFFLVKKPAIGTSRGELLEFIDLKISLPILIVNPGIHLSTKETFQNITPKELGSDCYNKLLSKQLDFLTLRECFINDFEEYVFTKHPEIGNIKDCMYKNGAKYSLMSGSGSTVFGIFDDLIKAEKTIEKIKKNYFTFISHPHK